MNERIDKFFAWVVDKNFFSVRSFMLYASVYMTMYATKWAASYVHEVERFENGTDVGLVVVAVTAPITAFTSFVYKWYSDSRAK